jgi:hypothetical protein
MYNTGSLIDEARWHEVRERGLKVGAHNRPSDGLCAMEAVAYIRRQPHSDHPPCVSPAIAALMRSWNDALPDAERSILLPLLPKLIDTIAPELEERRSMMAVDWYIRVHTPAWLDLAGLKDQAAQLRSLPEIIETAQMPSLRAPLEAIRQDASAAESAAWSAAESAAWSAARSAARSAAWSAARSAAWSAAESAAESAARSAAWSAARSAAESAARSAAESAAEVGGKVGGMVGGKVGGKVGGMVGAHRNESRSSTVSNRAG